MMGSRSRRLGVWGLLMCSICCTPEQHRPLTLREYGDEVVEYVHSSPGIRQPKYFGLADGYVEATWYGLLPGNETDAIVHMLKSKQQERGWGKIVLRFLAEEVITTSPIPGGTLSVRGDEHEYLRVELE